MEEIWNRGIVRRWRVRVRLLEVADGVAVEEFAMGGEGEGVEDDVDQQGNDEGAERGVFFG